MPLLFILTFFFSIELNANEKSICGATDEREFSSDSMVGRVLNQGDETPCTITMIGKVCAISAGHCRWSFGLAEFNTPKSRNGRMAPADPKDIYLVDPDSIYFENGGPGDDYAVMKLMKNQVTGLYPGEAQGFYGVSFESPVVGDLIRITGHGKDVREDRNFSQQTHVAPIVSIFQSIIQHRADTRFGNSGSSIIDEATKKIIGIHTHGACYSTGGSNYGTLFFGHRKLRQAIKQCLNSI